MGSLKYKLIGAAFEILSRMHITRLIRRLSACNGVIFTMHRVLPDPPAQFSPNAILQITPSFLEAAITRIKDLGFEIVSLDEAIARTKTKTKTAPFVVLTFDDAYRDNLIHALPILRRHNCPFTLYVPTAFVDGEGEIWWQALEDIIANNDTITPNADTRLDSATIEQKRTVFNALYWQMRDMPEPSRVKFIHDLATSHGFDLHAQCRDLIMDWKELAVFAKEPLCTIGAHTVHHYELSKLPASEARQEMANSVAIIKDKLGQAPQHLSYPIGSKRAAGEREYALAKDIGFLSAVTTRPGGLYPAGKSHLHALPRISFNGLYQNLRYIDVFLSGALFSLLGK